MNQIEFNRYYTNLMVATVLTCTLSATIISNIIPPLKEENSNQMQKITKELKVYNPYEHIFHIHYRKEDFINQTEKIIGIPKGYEILRIDTYDKEIEDDIQTEEYDIWYTNKEQVIANENDDTKAGIVLEQKESSYQKRIENKTI